MATVQITITADIRSDDVTHFSAVEAAAEMLFDFGIGNSGPDEEPWISMRGQTYEITDFQSKAIVIVGNEPVEINLNHHLTNMGVEPT